MEFASEQDAVWAERFFADRVAARAVWDEVVTTVDGFGPAQLTATQSRVCIKARTRFLWCPTAHVAGTIFVRFLHPAPIESHRLRSDPMPDGRWSHRVRLGAGELDAEVRNWLLAAYELDVS